MYTDQYICIGIGVDPRVDNEFMGKNMKVQMQVGICHGDVLPEPLVSTVLLLSQRQKVSRIVVSAFLSLGG